MRHNKLFLPLFTALLILAAVIFGTSEYAWDGTIGITAQISARGQTEEIRCWKEDRDDYYLFLPSYAELSQVRLKTNVSNRVWLDGREITGDMTCEGFQMDVEYDLCYQSRGREYHYSLTFLRSVNVPALYIDTASGSMEHIHEEKGNEEPGALRLYTADGALHYGGNLEQIKGRGNSTWEYQKKPYNLTLSSDADLLGMGAAKRWILLANAADASNLKNKLAYDLARDAGLAYTPDCAWVELYLNGEYAGLYLLTERNEVHENRVELTGTGSFLVVKDWEWRFRDEGDPYVMTDAKTALQIRYSDLPEEQLLEMVQSAENAILAQDGIDPVTGKHWRELIDVDSWVKKYLVEEVLENVDASTLSQFYYYDSADGRLFAGPIWDMDLTLRSPSAQWLEELNQFYGNRPRVYGSAWLTALYQNEEFYSRLTEVYAQTFLPLLTQLSENGIDAYYGYIRQAAYLDAVRWRTDQFEAECASLRQRLEKRIAFLNSLWVEKEPYVTVVAYDAENVIRSFAIPAGSCLPELPVYENSETTTYHGWYYWDTDIPVDEDQPLYEDVEIELRYTVREAEADPQPEAQPQPLSLVQLLPGMAFAALLGIMTAVGLRQSRSGRKKEAGQCDTVK